MPDLPETPRDRPGLELPDPSTLRRARDTAIGAALDAARLIRFEAGHVDAARLRSKGVHDYVTDVDERAQEVILGHIRAVFPEHDVLAEEESSGSQPTGSAWRWIVDPIDGTTNFTHGIAPYAVSIALQFRERSVVAVVLDVPHDELFTAVRGDGAFCNGRPIGVSRTRLLADSLLTTGFPYRAFGHVDTYLDVMKTFFTCSRGIRRPGSASVDLAGVAAGRFDGFFETGLSPWDVAAGLLLVEEAGGTVTDFGDGSDPIFAGEILATNGLIHAEMASVTAPLRGRRA